MGYDVGTTDCSEFDCEAFIKNHKWGHIKEGADWVFLKTGESYCPEHIPEWYPAWKEKQDAGKKV